MENGEEDGDELGDSDGGFVVEGKGRFDGEEVSGREAADELVHLGLFVLWLVGGRREGGWVDLSEAESFLHR